MSARGIRTEALVAGPAKITAVVTVPATPAAPVPDVVDVSFPSVLAAPDGAALPAVVSDVLTAEASAETGEVSGRTGTGAGTGAGSGTGSGPVPGDPGDVGDVGEPVEEPEPDGVPVEDPPVEDPPVEDPPVDDPPSGVPPFEDPPFDVASPAGGRAACCGVAAPEAALPVPAEAPPELFDPLPPLSREAAEGAFPCSFVDPPGTVPCTALPWVVANMRIVPGETPVPSNAPPSEAPTTTTVRPPATTRAASPYRARHSRPEGCPASLTSLLAISDFSMAASPCSQVTVATSDHPDRVTSPSRTAVVTVSR